MAAVHTQPVQVRLTPADHRRLQERAAAENRRPADLARHLLLQALAGEGSDRVAA